MKQLSAGYLTVLGSNRTHTRIRTTDSLAMWVFDGAGRLRHTKKYVNAANTIGTYRNAVNTTHGDKWLVGNKIDQTTTVANGFAVRTDSLGNWRGPVRVPPGPPGIYGSYGLYPLADGGVLWEYTSKEAIPNTTAARYYSRVVRLDSVGNAVWQRQYGSPYSETKAMTSLADGSYVIVGTQVRPLLPGPGYYAPDMWVLRIRANGDSLSSRLVGLPADQEYPTDVQALPGGGFLVTGALLPGRYLPVYNPNALPVGWLVYFDSAGNVVCELRVPGGGGALNYFIPEAGQPLANGDVVLSGRRSHAGPPFADSLDGYVGTFRPNGSAPPTPVWGEQLPWLSARNLLLTPNGELTVGGQQTINTSGWTFYPGLLTHYRNAGQPYVPDYCQTPPAAYFAYGPGAAPGTVQFLDASTAGLAYAELVRWRWDFGDGTHYDGPAPPPHRYPAGAPASTAVRLTVSNSLGCMHSYAQFPLSASPAAQALQAQLAVYPNPAPGGGAVAVRLPGLRSQAPVAGELRTALGQLVRRVTFSVAQLAQGAPLGAEGLAPGLYVLHLRPAEGAVVRKLLVQ